MSSAAKAPAAIEGSGLCRRFNDGQREITVLQDLDVRVERGQSVAVVGESGVGKSTLLHVLGTLDHPDAGRVSIGGRDMSGMPSRELAVVRNGLIGFVFQFHYLLGDFSAEENVMMPLLVGRKSHSQARKRAREVLARVGLAERMNHRPGELSGGEQQRVAVARAVVTEPEVVLADEPTGNLDPGTAEDMHELLREIQRESGCSMLIATHNPALALLLDRTLRMSAGRLEEVRS